MTASGAAKVPLAKGVDLGNAKRVRILVREYSAVKPSGATLVVEGYQAWPTPVDPKEPYELVPPGATAARAPVLKGLLPDVVGTAPLPAVFIADDAGGTPKVAEYVGPTLDLFLTATVGASTGTFTCGITVALELWDA